MLQVYVVIFTRTRDILMENVPFSILVAACIKFFKKKWWIETSKLVNGRRVGWLISDPIGASFADNPLPEIFCNN